MQGVVIEREAALKIYKIEKSAGKAVTITTINKEEHSITTTKIGNLPARQKVLI